MQLTRLEVKGFKSFGDKAVINFDEGITGIVGPNGCGKSNVIDAIRWVLGEQKTKALRSEKMENVIFNGTKNRRPTQLAEVSLTFRNTKNLLPTEYATVMITRRYYRTGDSEYELNGVKCRLKDIHNLFLDTGISSNSYAIIELKMVDELLNDKDNSRRGLFEEAAGVSKFRVRKKETLKKLGDTDADLERVEDLLFEIEKNMKSLERQARQAKRYFSLKEEYKHASVELAKVSVKTQADALIRTQEQIQAQHDETAALSGSIAEAEASSEKLKLEILQKERLLSGRQRTLNEKTAKIQQIENDRKIKNEKLKFLKDQEFRLEGQREEDEAQQSEQLRGVEGLDMQIASLRRMSSELLWELEEKKAALDTDKALLRESQSEQAEFEEKMQRSQHDFFQMQKDSEFKQLRLSSLKQELEQFEHRSCQELEQLAEFQERTAGLQAQTEELEAELQSLKESQNRWRQQDAELSEAVEEKRERIIEKQQAFKTLQATYELKKKLNDNLEGYPEAIQFLHQEKKYPLLADLISCAEPDKALVGSFLEPYMNCLVLPDQCEALEAIDLLRRAQKGRASFLVLENVPETSESPLSSKIEAAPKFRQLVNWLTRNSMIGHSLNGEIAGAHPEGFWAKQRVIVRGGEKPKLESLRLGSAKDLEKLRLEIEKLDAELQKLLEEKQMLAERHRLHMQEDLSKLIEEKAESLGLSRQQLGIVRHQYEERLQRQRNESDKKDCLLEELGVLGNEVAALAPKLCAGKDELEEIKQEKEKGGEKAQILSRSVQEKSEAFNAQNLRFYQHENRLEQLEQEKRYKEDALRQLALKMASEDNQLKQCREDIQAVLDAAETGEDVLIGLHEEKECIESGVREAEKSYFHSRGRQEQIGKEIRELQRKKEQSQALVMHLQQSMSETRLALNSVKERMQIEFGIDIEEQLDRLNPEEETENANRFMGMREDALVKEAEQLKQKLDRIGPVNPMALEAFEEIKERFEFIVSQKKDLENAKGSLLQTISEIDAVAKEAFLDAFGKIKQNFIKVFRSLFTEEDDCDLRLLNPEDPLNSKIDIIAKPKGKRPLTINQLSGGEKTLTATSLLFSIYLLKPAPFCIFDEVDAPLDDANIDKFNKIVRTFSEDSQFIIVTHNKRTMASTDVIYGVTMLEQGVSRVIPVDLRDLTA
ncbi:MAG: chromosome segregation protein SMC [Cytophagales bacterium]|nr:chromosome segregation protein SMC [Cytophagales bacterium]